MRARTTHMIIAALAAITGLLSGSQPAQAAPRPPQAAAFTAPGAFNPLKPVRVLDTRYGTGAAGPVFPNQVIRLPIRGRHGVGADAGSVILNVTVTQPSAAGYVTVYPDATAPTASNLNFVAGQTVPNLVVCAIGADGYLSIRNASPGTIHLLADLAGYYQGGKAVHRGMFQPMSPARLIDTRVTTGPVGPGGSIDVQVTGTKGIPATHVQAVFLNTTVTQPQRDGYVTAWPSGTPRPTASSLNFRAGQTIPNLVMVKIGANGKVSLYNGSAGTAHLIADVAGYVLDGIDSEQPGAFIPHSPERIIDTRLPSWRTGKLRPHWEGIGCFAPWVGGVIANVTAIEPEAAGFITVAPRTGDLPAVSNVNFLAGQTVPNLSTSPVDSKLMVSFYNGSPGATHLVVDLAGGFVGAGGLNAPLPSDGNPCDELRSYQGPSANAVGLAQVTAATR